MRSLAHGVGIALVLGLILFGLYRGLHVRLSWVTAERGQRLAFAWILAVLVFTIAAMLALVAVELSR